jgi:putative transposase
VRWLTLRPMMTYPSDLSDEEFSHIQGRGKRWVEEMMGLSVEVVRKPQKPLPEEVAERWGREWSKEGKEVDWQSLMPPRGFTVLPRRWVVERTFSWLGQNRRMSKDYERLAESSEAFV